LFKQGHSDAVLNLIITADSVFSSSSDSTAKQWSKASGQLIRSFTYDAPNEVASVALSGDYLICGTQKGIIVHWNINDGSVFRTYEGKK
jgi:WD40 repeat protein